MFFLLSCICGASLVRKGRYLPIYSALDLSLANLTGCCKNGAEPSEQLGKLPELAAGPLHGAIYEAILAFLDH